MAQHLKNQVAVVTGGGGAIGRGISMELAAQGAKVVVNDLGGAVDGTGRSKSAADGVVEEIRSAGGEAVANYYSVTTMEGGESLIKNALDSFGRLDILVHVAGILRDRMLFNMTEEEWDGVIAVHLKGMFATSKPASILFRQQRSGRIIGFSSTSGLYGQAGQTNYGSAKDGIAGFVRVVARDLGRYGATANGIAPAANTRMTQSISDEARELRARAGMGSSQATQLEVPPRDPNDVAPMVAYLCTDEAKDINGQIFFVSGGTVSLFNNPYPIRTMQKEGRWTFEEIALLYPGTLGKDVANPAPVMAPRT